MDEESIAVELTESEIYVVKLMMDHVLILNKVLYGSKARRSLFKKLELKMLKARDAIQAKKDKTTK